MTADEFVKKWAKAQLSERAASQEHFIDLCHLLGQPTPAEADASGEDYCFEKHVKVVGSASRGSKGDYGFVDVWKRGVFGWEYKQKGKYRSLDEAYRQLYQYRDDLDNPPLSIVCDIRTLVIRTHFQGYPTEKMVIALEEFPAKLRILEKLFTDPNYFRPAKKREQVTVDVARVFAEFADMVIKRDPTGGLLPLYEGAGSPTAHFLMKVMFCLFAEKIDLLPHNVFSSIVNDSLFDPDQFQPRATELFQKMREGGYFGADKIPYFNGGLFDEAPAMRLTHSELHALRRVTDSNWAGVEPSVFGTLFERLLDPDKRAQIGAHYTSKDDIKLVIDPVIMAPLRKRWTEIQAELATTVEKANTEPDAKKRGLLSSPVPLAVEGFRKFLHEQRVLDPACGSGNFLYVALQELLDLEDEVVRFSHRMGFPADRRPRVRPTQMHGIEINRYAAELAQVVIWIGFLQWLHDHAIEDERRPILDKLQMIENRDAILEMENGGGQSACQMCDMA